MRQNLKKVTLLNSTHYCLDRGVHYTASGVVAESNIKGRVMRMKRQIGFTLIELAVVVFLIGLLASMGLGAFKAQMLNGAIRSTQGNQGAIKDALMAYLAKNKRLPCPAVDNSGAEGRNLTVIPPPNCNTYYGLVPYVELGLTKSSAMDGWDNFFSYGVSPQWTATYNSTPPGTQYNTTNPANAFNVGVPGIIIVNDRNQATGTVVTITSVAAAVVISQGANGYGAYTAKFTKNDATGAGADEAANIPPSPFSTITTSPPPYYKRDYTSNTTAQGGAYDDVVMVLNPNDLLIPLIKDGALKSAQGQWADQVASIKALLIGTMISTCKVPSVATPTPSYAIDPWGNSIKYTTTLTPSQSLDLSATPAGNTYAATPAYTLNVIAPNPSAPTINGPLVSEALGGISAWSSICP